MARPLQKFHDFVGQRRSVERIERLRQGATASGVPLPHLLLAGGSGLGKTEFAEALAKAQSTKLHQVDGRLSEKEIAERFQQCSFADIVFIDEAHQLAASVQELLYGVIDNARFPRRVASVADDTGQKPAEFIEVARVTLILATDQPGKLRNALRRRIPNVEHFRPYAVREMQDIVDNQATRQKILLSPQARNVIARVSRGIPRRAVHHLNKVKLYFPNSATEQVDLGMIREYLRACEIDSVGLGPIEREYMCKLLASTTASLETLARSLGFDADYVYREVEYALFDLGFIVIGPQGRQLTDVGRQHLETRAKRKTCNDTNTCG